MPKKTFVIEMIIVLILLSVVYLPTIGSVPFHIDESFWIASSNMFEAFFKGEFNSEVWHYSYAAITSQPVPRYLIGIGRYVGGFNQEELNTPWNFNRNKNFNIRKGAMPSDELLWWSRLPMAILGVFSVALGYIFIKKIVGYPAGFFWLFFGVNSYLLLHNRRAMAESSLLFFTMLGIWFCWLTLQKIQKDKTIFSYKAIGFLAFSAGCIALAGQTKLNGLALFAVVILSLGLVLSRLGLSLKNWLKAMAGGSAILFFITMVVFWFLYPFLWPDPIGRTVDIYENRMAEMKGQTIRHAPDYLKTIEQRVTIIPMRIFEDYAAISFRGSFWLNLGLCLAGIFVTAQNIIRWWKKERTESIELIMLLAAFICSAPISLTLLDWDRYYLLPVVFSSFFIAVALGHLMNRLLHQTKLFLNRPNKIHSANP